MSLRRVLIVSSLLLAACADPSEEELELETAQSSIQWRYADLYCSRSGSNSGCDSFATCPDGYVIYDVRVACNLELASATQQDLDATDGTNLRVFRDTDVEKQNHECSVASRFGKTSHKSPGNSRVQNLAIHWGAKSVTAHCHEADQNGGDCALIGDVVCWPDIPG